MEELKASAELTYSNMQEQFQVIESMNRRSEEISKLLEKMLHDNEHLYGKVQRAGKTNQAITVADLPSSPQRSGASPSSVRRMQRTFRKL